MHMYATVGRNSSLKPYLISINCGISDWSAYFGCLILVYLGQVVENESYI